VIWVKSTEITAEAQRAQRFCSTLCVLCASAVQIPSLLHRLPPGRQGTAALAAGAAGALGGALLSRFAGPDTARRAPWATRLWAFTVLLMSGAGAGLVVKASRFGALGGLLGAAAFLPVFAAVLEAGRRAARARLGSIVAGAARARRRAPGEPGARDPAAAQGL
jgi:hypothetical protein